MATPVSTAATASTLIPAQMMRQAGLLVAIAASVAIGGYVALNLIKPDMTVLTGGLEARDLSALAGDLETAGIKHSVDFTRGVILVDNKRKSEALRFVADKDLSSNFDRDPFLDEEPPMTETFLRERERMKRSQEVRLARTISEMAYVKNARVHLATPKPSPFLRNTEEPRASVMLEMYQGRRLSEEQIAGIVQIVVNSVANLTPDNITLIDHQGYPLNSPESGELAQAARRLDYKRHIEEEKVRKVTELLAPYVGFDGVQAKVDAEIDFTEIEQAIDYHDPDRGAVISMEERTLSRESNEAAGVPGALSNAPPGTATAPEQIDPVTGLPLADAGSPEEEFKERQIRRNQVPATREIKHVKSATGRIERLTVAVMVRRDLLPVSADNSVDPEVFQQQEIERIRRLIIGAVGINEARGDTLTVEAVNFRTPEVMEPIPGPPIWAQPWVATAARQIGGAMVALLVLFGIIRPAIRSLNRPTSNRLMQNMPAEFAQAGADEIPQLPSAEAPSTQSINQALRTDGGLSNDMDQIKGLVGNDPRLATQVVRKWLEEG